MAQKNQHSPRMLGSTEVAAYLGVSRRSVYNYVEAGSLVSHKLEDGTHVFLKADVEDFLKYRFKKQTRRQEQRRYNTLEEAAAFFLEPHKPNKMSRRQALQWVGSALESGEMIITIVAPNPELASIPANQAKEIDRDE